jgi:hypothetical protein
MSGFVAEIANNVQVDRKNPLSVTLYGAENLDVRSIDISSLRLAGGLFGSNPTSGGEIHGKAHIGHKNKDGYKDLTAHFASNESDLMCGSNEATVTGMSDGVPFTTTVSYRGIGNKKDDQGNPTCPR